MPATTNHPSVEKLNQANEGKLPGHLGLVITEVADGKVAEIEIERVVIDDDVEVTMRAVVRRDPWRPSRVDVGTVG